MAPRRLAASHGRCVRRARWSCAPPRATVRRHYPLRGAPGRAHRQPAGPSGATPGRSTAPSRAPRWPGRDASAMVGVAIAGAGVGRGQGGASLGAVGGRSVPVRSGAPARAYRGGVPRARPSALGVLSRRQGRHRGGIDPNETARVLWLCITDFHRCCRGRVCSLLSPCAPTSSAVALGQTCRPPLLRLRSGRLFPGALARPCAGAHCGGSAPGAGG